MSRGRHNILWFLLQNDFFSSKQPVRFVQVNVSKQCGFLNAGMGYGSCRTKRGFLNDSKLAQFN